MKKVDLSKVWSVKPDAIIGLVCTIETVDGSVRRNARISGVRWRNIEVDGARWPVPHAFEINDDGGDLMVLDHIQRITDLVDPR